MCGMLVWAVFIAMDKKYDKQAAEEALRNEQPVSKEDKFKFSDIFKVLGNKHYILISLLCVFFYACIISFRRFATSISFPALVLKVTLPRLWWQ
jgi:hypothetical protein